MVSSHSVDVAMRHDGLDDTFVQSHALTRRGIYRVFLNTSPKESKWMPSSLPRRFA